MAHESHRAYELIEAAHARGRMAHAYLVSGAPGSGKEELAARLIQMVNGGECPSVLCQEFLRGKEYVVDHVSRDGVHKVVMVWVYDKRPCNGSAVSPSKFLRELLFPLAAF